MVDISIKEPIWSSRSVGIASSKVTDDIIVRIEYTDKSGNRTFPGLYYMDKDSAKKYPTQTVRGKKLYIIPIDDFDSI